MKEKKLSEFMGVRESIRVLDATLRDGGLVNNFYFTDEFVRALYETNIKAGVDYMELGYKASKEIFSKDEFGVWKFCDDEDILRVIGENSEKKIKLAVMADVGRCDYKTDIQDRSNSPVDMVRVATYVHQMPGAIDMIEDAKKKGYEVKLRSDSGTILKYPSLRPPDAKGFFRFHKLGEGYALEDILEKVANNYRRQLPFPEMELL